MSGPLHFYRSRLGKMLRDELCHLEHIDDRLTAEDRLQSRICVDIALILRILEIVLLDIDPELLHDLRARHRALAHDLGEIGAYAHRFHKC